MEPKVYLRHIKNEKDHWWFKARRAIINSIKMTTVSAASVT